MTREEKMGYVVSKRKGPFNLQEEQEQVKFTVMQSFVKARKEKGITQDELANITGIARSNIARMENGSYNPTIEMMVRLAAGIGMRLDIQWVDADAMFIKK